MNNIVKGFKTSELYVVVAVLFPSIIESIGPILQALGLDIPLPTSSEQVVELANELRDLGNGKYWVAGLYVVGRWSLKWKAEKRA